MLGAIAGDIIGSIYEFNNVKYKNCKLFTKESRFTDDSVLTVATMDSIINEKPFNENYKQWFRRHPDAGYGGSFIKWGFSDDFNPYNSWGNGSAMRVSPIGYYYNTLEEVLIKAKESALVTHNHPEGIKGAQAVASAVFLAKNNSSKEEIKHFIEDNFGYDLNESIDSIRAWYKFDVSCQGSVPQAIIAFLESSDYEDAIRNAISIGGDSDTIACITGGMAEAFYKEIPKFIIDEVYMRLPEEMIQVVKRFYLK